MKINEIQFKSMKINEEALRIIEDQLPILENH